MAAIGHQEADRVPVSPRADNFLREYYGCACWLHWLKAAQEFDFDPMIILEPNAPHVPETRQSYVPLHNYIKSWAETYSDLEDVRIEIEIDRQPSMTFVKRRIQTPAGTLTDALQQPLPDKGFGAWPDPSFTERMVKDKRDLDKVRFLIPTPNPMHLTDIAEIDESVGERGLVEVYVNSALDHKLGEAVGLIELMLLYYDDRQLLGDLLQLFHENTMAETRAVLEAGCRIVYGTWHYASLSVGWSPAIFREMFLPLVKEHVALVHTYGALYHYYDDGKIMGILPMIAEAGVDLLSTLCPKPVGDFELSEAKLLIGDRVCLKGYIDLLYVINFGTPQLIRETVRQAIMQAAEGGGFILGTSDSIRESPLDNVKAYFQAGREYGNYEHLGTPMIR